MIKSLQVTRLLAYGNVAVPVLLNLDSEFDHDDFTFLSQALSAQIGSSSGYVSIASLIYEDIHHDHSLHTVALTTEAQLSIRILVSTEDIHPTSRSSSVKLRTPEVASGPASSSKWNNIQFAKFPRNTIK